MSPTLCGSCAYIPMSQPLTPSAIVGLRKMRNVEKNKNKDKESEKFAGDLWLAADK